MDQPTTYNGLGKVPAVAAQVRPRLLAVLSSSDGQQLPKPYEEQIVTPQASAQAVLGASGDVPADTPTIRGWDFAHGRDLDSIMDTMIHTGFQATSFGQAIEEVNRLVRPQRAICEP